ncbi:class I SAM-dependent methyltransferase [Vulgatibacter sp.]|uniref:class I SAM-dependent methyltransferase n=1 Tax=Vulgatibacter sp. TaxID=1971226 RepID=UPI003562DEB3
MNRTTDGAAFWDRLAPRYSRMPIKDEAAYQHKLAVTQSHFRKDMAVLEFGCGTGSTALLHAPHVRSILATDLSEKMLEIAREKARHAGVTNVTFEKASFETLRAEDEGFDAVLGLSILHLLADLDGALHKVYRLLKPGGRFFSSTVCIGEMGVVTRLALPMATWLGLAPQVNELRAGEIAESLERTGFAIDYTWRPRPGSPVFIVARKPGADAPPGSL